MANASATFENEIQIGTLNPLPVIGRAMTVLVRRQTTNREPWVEFFKDGVSGRIVLPANSTWAFKATVVGRRIDAGNESYAVQHVGCIDNNAGAVELVGTVSTTVWADDSGGVWQSVVSADDTNNSLKIVGNGQDGKTINWLARVELTEVT